MTRTEICGNIASGKTTLCQWLDSKGYIPAYEDFQHNPFLDKFYKEPEKYSFETEISFLLQHYHLIKLRQTGPRFACDFSLILDMAYADVNLEGNRHRLFAEIVSELVHEISLPNRLILLTCPEEILFRRISERKRESESSISIDYLQCISKALFRRIKGLTDKIPVITIDSYAVDFRDEAAIVRELEAV